MIDDIELVATRLLVALLAGSVIGLERTFHGRPAGFRTHSLVCVASSLLMLLVAFQSLFVPEELVESVRMDPTRMAQGIMTGIGFLGAGVIVREGTTVRGLTTAASIWMTAAIGITVGVGFYRSAAMATVLSLGVLAALRWIERVMPAQQFARLVIGSPDGSMMTEKELMALLKSHQISGVNTGYRLESEGQKRMLRFEATIRTGNSARLYELAESLRSSKSIEEFSITPSDA